jgi:hypothetical protein
MASHGSVRLHHGRLGGGCSTRACRAHTAVAVLLAFGSDATLTRRLAQINTGTDDDERHEVAPPAPSAPANVALAPEPSAPADRTYFLGVVSDLSLTQASTRAPACRCLAVGYGLPADPKFAWKQGPPRVETGTMAVAIAADGVACSAPGYAPLRASISAVERAGDDIVVVVENVREGRPPCTARSWSRRAARARSRARARRGAPYGAPAGGGQGPRRVSLE